MTYSKIRFIRHGEGQHMATPDIIAGRAPSASLTATGVEQAKRRGELWQEEGYRPDIAESSPILRCRMTAAGVMKAAGLTMPLQEQPGIAEMCHGVLEGQERTPAIRARMDSEGGNFRAPGYNAEGLPGESFGDVAARWNSYLSTKAQEASDAVQDIQVAAFTHRVLLGTGLSYLALRAEHGTADISPHDIRDRYMDTRISQPLPPCSETLLIVETTESPEQYSYHIEYVGKQF
jgi:broad specificity phosphatase PhoE